MVVSKVAIFLFAGSASEARSSSMNKYFSSLDNARKDDGLALTFLLEWIESSRYATSITLSVWLTSFVTPFESVAMILRSENLFARNLIQY